jgi:hypothetical protein
MQDRRRAAVSLFYTVWLTNRWLWVQVCQECIQSVDEHHPVWSPMEWHWPNSPIHKYFDFKTKKIKVNLVTFSESQGIIHKEFVPPGQKMNKEYFVEFLSCSIQRICQVRSQFRERGSHVLLCDNARPHTAVLIKQFLENKGFQNDIIAHILLIYPDKTYSYSPKSNSCWKIEDIKRNATKELLALYENEFRVFLTSKKVCDISRRLFWRILKDMLNLNVVFLKCMQSWNCR